VGFCAEPDPAFSSTDGAEYDAGKCCTMKLVTYIVGQGDTLEILAQKLMGDLSQVGALIQINLLRYPYISDKPIDQFSGPKGVIYLTAQHVDASQLNTTNPNSIVILPNDTVFLLQGNASGSSVIVGSSQLVISLASPINGTFDQAAIATIFTNQQNVTTQVLKTGDVLLYPSDRSASTGSDSLFLGTDWKLDQKGFLVKTDGDIAMVSGLDNLFQALSLRLKTAIGSLNLHNDYGNGMYRLLGEANQPQFKGLVKYHIEKCAAQDIRIRNVKVTEITISEGKVFASLTLIPAGNQDPITKPLIIPIGGT
jgi:phage baseplate assembly protein W